MWFYVGKLALPVNLTFFYRKWLIDAGVWWQYLFPVTALTVVATLWGVRKRLGRGPVTAVLFFCGTLMPALGFINIAYMWYAFVADRFV